MRAIRVGNAWVSPKRYKEMQQGKPVQQPEQEPERVSRNSGLEIDVSDENTERPKRGRRRKDYDED